MRNGLFFVVCLLALAGCSEGTVTCEPRDSIFCESGVSYWLNSCNEREEVFEHCQDGCKEDNSGCAGSCTPQCAGKCCGDDGCGGSCPDNCAASGQTCNSSCECEGACQTPNCQSLDAECGTHQDPCGGAPIECGTCQGNGICTPYGQCVCTPECTDLCCGDDGCGSTCPDLCAISGQACNPASCACEGICERPTCEELEVECGSHEDPCGGDPIVCADCPALEQCDLGGLCECMYTNCVGACCAQGEVCHAGACCSPQTCQGLGLECGDDWDDGCGGTLECGDCDLDQICDGSGLCQAELENFSFFVTSLASLIELSGSEDGFGGDLTFGESGPGAGLTGADKICTTIAEMSMPGSAVKMWRAFLSVSDDGNGNQVDAIDRIGSGPWYDRVGRMLAPGIPDLLNERPENGDPIIADDLPNEWGVPNHRPDPTQPEVDNHHMLTGSNAAGELYSSSATCQDWTTANGSSSNGRPRCGMAWPRGMGPSGENWISAFSAPGCAAGVDFGGVPPPGSDYVGAGGGYGGFYCFALEP